MLTPGVWVRRECARGRLSLREVQGVARQLLERCGFHSEGLNVLLVSDRRMRALNKLYLGHDTTTDVLAFPLDTSAFHGSPVLAGEIVISLETALKQAPQYGHTFRQEFYFYLCHGILHLAGWNDKTVRERARMFRKQKKILKALGILKV